MSEPIFDHSITCNGYRILITRNLFLALRGLRKADKRVLWVDQLCIEQANVAERNHQVGIMLQIYQMLQDITWAGFDQLYENPCFFRCWVVQEVLAKPHPIAFIGDFELEWGILPLAQLATYAHESIKIQRLKYRDRNALTNPEEPPCMKRNELNTGRQSY